MTRRGKAVLKEAGGMMGRAGRGKERKEGKEGEEGEPLVGSERSLCSEEGGVPSKVLWERFQTKKRKKKNKKKNSDYIFNRNVHCLINIERDNNAVQERGMDI